MAPKSFPVPNGTTSFWRTQPDALDNHRSSAVLPEESDIVVIGAGYAGASIVHHLLEQSGPSSTLPSIVILEARQACSGATGRNGGHMKPDAYNAISTIAAEHGVNAASEVAAFEARHVPFLKDFIQKEKIDCDYVVTTAVDVQLDEKHCEKLKAGYDRLIADGSEPTKKVQFTPKQNAETFSGVKGAQGCFSYTAGHIWPYKFVLHLLNRAVARGVNLQTNTIVTSISDSLDANSGRWTVNTSRGSIKARQVVFATNAYTAALAPQYQDKIVPVRGVCSRIVVPQPGGPRLSNTYTLRFNSWDYDYLIPRPDGSIIVGGARSKYLHNLDDWYGSTDDGRLIESAAHYFDNYMQRHFHGWENSEAYTDRVWTGIMGYSSDGLPHIGQVPGKPGQFILAGFTGHGMPRIFLSAKGVAQMMLTGAEFEDTGIPRVFKTTQARLESRKNRILDSYQESRKVNAHL